MMAGASGQVITVEIGPGEIDVIYPDDRGYVTHTNHFYGPRTADIRDTGRMAFPDTYLRLGRIADLLREKDDRKIGPEDIKEGKPRKYGFHTNVSTKKTIIHNLKAVLRDHLYIERDAGCLDEYATYIEDEGRFEATQGHHDDRLMTRAIGLHVCFREMEIPTIVNRAQKMPQRKKTISAATL